MAILTFPSTLTPRKCTWGLMSNAETFVSPLNGAVQTANRPGDRWKATLEFAVRSLDELGQFEAFMAQLAGMSNRAYVPPFHRRGTGAAASVNGASQVGSSLVVSGAGANRTFKPGDFFSVNGEFKMIASAAVADATGNATISFVPMLRASPPTGATLIFSSPTAVMFLNTQEYAITRYPGSEFDLITMPFMEAFT